jgi:hypothetical protein
VSGRAWPRGTTNRNDRGNTEARRRRRQWLLSPESGFGGDGVTVECHMRVSPDCLMVVTEGTLSVDRFPVDGVDGGRYVRGNIRPGCPPCQSLSGGRLAQERRRSKAATA